MRLDLENEFKAVLFPLKNSLKKLDIGEINGD
jgi:hypothetical protein